jgi:type I restriction-modification system DNA methylase subunit
MVPLIMMKLLWSFCYVRGTIFIYEKTTQDIVAKLWNLCNILKDGRVSYHQYFIELTYLLFLKMAKETGTENRLPEGYRWDDLEGILKELGEEVSV